MQIQLLWRINNKMQQARTNKRIRARSVLLIDADGNNLGEINFNQALSMAAESGLDLVEVGSQGKIPVCRIMDYGKWKYDCSKKQKKNKSGTSKKTLKEIKFRPNTSDNDLSYRAKQVDKFIGEGHTVKLVVRYRGREQEHMYKTSKALLTRFFDMLTCECSASQVNSEFKSMVVTLFPSNKK